MITDQQFERLLSMKHKKQYFYQVADSQLATSLP